MCSTKAKRWRATLTASRLDEDFRADNGYIPQVGIRQYAGELRYKISDLAKFSELAPYVTLDTARRASRATA